MSALPAIAKPRRIKSAHRRRRRIASGQSVQRYYDPQIGLFLSVDPVTADSNPVGQFHRYRYAANNPYRFTDPDGRKEKPFDPKNDPPRNVHEGTATPLWLAPDSAGNSQPNQDAVNCHSAAWSDGQGDPGDPANEPSHPRWDNSVQNQVDTARANGGQLSPNAPNNVGDTVVYYTDTNGNGRADTSELAARNVHSAVVIEVDAEGNTTRVISKEGEGNYSDHHPSDQNPAYGRDKEWYRP